jgi:hypothetical protein
VSRSDLAQDRGAVRPVHLAGSTDPFYFNLTRSKKTDKIYDPAAAWAVEQKRRLRKVTESKHDVVHVKHQFEPHSHFLNIIK